MGRPLGSKNNTTRTAAEREAAKTAAAQKKAATAEKKVAKYTSQIDKAFDRIARSTFSAFVSAETRLANTDDDKRRELLAAEDAYKAKVAEIEAKFSALSTAGTLEDNYKSKVLPVLAALGISAHDVPAELAGYIAESNKDTRDQDAILSDLLRTYPFMR